jgi:hypothetical protein
MTVMFCKVWHEWARNGVKDHNSQFGGIFWTKGGVSLGNVHRINDIQRLWSAALSVLPGRHLGGGGRLLESRLGQKELVQTKHVPVAVPDEDDIQ